MVEPGDKGSEHLLTLCLHTSEGPVKLISTYAPTLTSTYKAKHKFYTNLNDAIKNIHSNKHLVLLGVFNGRVRADHASWPSCPGFFGISEINEHVQHLLELCSHHSLCITNAYLQTKQQHRVSWHHPHSKHWHPSST